MTEQHLRPAQPATSAPANLQATNCGRPRPEHDKPAIGPTVSRQVAPAGFDEHERFAAWVAHELRTPLATQRAMLELTLADPAADTATWREAGEGVLSACKQQERLLEACLTLARSQAKLQRRETIDLGLIVSKVVQNHDLHTLTAELQLERAFTSGDPDLIERLVANLVTNAIPHNHVGGWIHVTTSSTDNQALLMIENTGTPICPAEIPRLFEPFEQLRPRTTASQSGLGLGLVVAKAVADTHDAVISAAARPAGGLRVELVFSGSALGDPWASSPMARMPDTSTHLTNEPAAHRASTPGRRP